MIKPTFAVYFFSPPTAARAKSQLRRIKAPASDSFSQRLSSPYTAAAGPRAELAPVAALPIAANSPQAPSTCPAAAHSLVCGASAER